MAGERTEQATQHRREKARREGDILHSKELSSAAGTLAGVIALGSLGVGSLIAWRKTFAGFLVLGGQAKWEPAEVMATVRAMRSLMLSVFAAPMLTMGAVVVAALAMGLLQTGGVQFHGGAIGFKPERINPLSNIKNLF